jgi:thiol-disulfide isomerase/thioredoxin
MNFKTPKKSTLQNIAFIVFLGLLLFSPLGTLLKVQVSRLLAFSPKTIALRDQEKLSTYQWQLLDGNGKVVSLEEYKGKIILVNFWATWCPPCIAEMPSMNKLYADYQEKIVFLFVTTDSFEKANAFLAKENLQLPIFQSVSNPPINMESETIPATYVIDQHQNVIIAKVGPADWNGDAFRLKLDDLQKDQ